MSTNEAALALHPMTAALLASHPHKETVTQSLHKTASAASSVAHVAGPEGAIFAVCLIAFILIVISSGFKKATGGGSS